MHRSILGRVAATLILSASAAAQIPLPATLSDATFGPLLTGTTYVAPGTVLVPNGATLTIQPGVVIKLDGTTFRVQGTVSALGTAAQPIVFTSMHDDAVGVPIGTSAPQPGDWVRMQFESNSDASRFEWCTFRYAGRAGRDVLELFGSDLTLLDCVIRDGANRGLFMQGSDPVVQRCSFVDNGGIAMSGARFPNLVNFLDNTASGNGGGDSVLVTSGTVSSSLALGPRNGIGGVILFGAGWNLVGSGTILDLLPGLIIKFVLGASDVATANAGTTVRSRGTAADPVVITSAADDSIGGDAVGDGPTMGIPGGWRSLTFQGGSTCDLEHTRLRFGGRNGFMIRAINAQIRIHDSVLEHSASAGINFNGGVGPTNVPDIRRCAFRDNGTRAIDSINWVTIPGLADNTASGNGSGDHLVILGTGSSGQQQIWRHNTLNDSGVIESPGLTVAGASTSMQFGPGLILKLQNPSSDFTCIVNATLTFEGRGDAPVVVTSVLDDEFGGDTNGDGPATVPAPGSIRGIQYGVGSNGSASHLRVRYGGFGSTGAVTCVSNNVRLTSVRSDLSATSGIRALALSGVAANWVAWRNVGAGIDLASGGFDVQHATSTENTGFGLVGAAVYTGTIYSSVVWNNVDNTEPNNFVGVRDRCRSCNGILVNGNLFADPLFVDPANGDLHISPTSLNVGRGDLVQATAWGEDFDGNSRILDHTENGLALPDIGAFEVFRYRMGLQGEARLGNTMQFSISGPGPTGGGLQFALFGPAIGGEFIPPFGIVLIGSIATVLPFAAAPIGTSFALGIPDNPALLGMRFGIQTLVVPDLTQFAGHFTNPVLATITD